MDKVKKKPYMNSPACIVTRHSTLMAIQKESIAATTANRREIWRTDIMKETSINKKKVLNCTVLVKTFDSERESRF